VSSHAATIDGTNRSSCAGSCDSDSRAPVTSMIAATGSATRPRKGTAATWLAAYCTNGCTGLRSRIDIRPWRTSSLICHTTHEPVRLRTIRTVR
jgi:hypothetical protein